MSKSFLNLSVTTSSSASPALGGRTFRILQASSSVRPEETMLFDAWEFPLAAAWRAYWLLAEACRHAAANARPTTWKPTTAIWVMIRCACTTSDWDPNKQELALPSKSRYSLHMHARSKKLFSIERGHDNTEGRSEWRDASKIPW